MIGSRRIDVSNRPFIIAEMSGNHNQSLDRALALVEAAAKSGADALKLQTYTADTITIKSDEQDFLINDGLWAGQSLYDLYDQAHMPWEWHKPLFEYAKELLISLLRSSKSIKFYIPCEQQQYQKLNYSIDTFYIQPFPFYLSSLFD